LQSVTGQQGVVYRHIILMALSLNFPKKEPLKSPKSAVVNNPTLIWGPHQKEPLRVSAHTLYFQKLESSAYIFVAGCMGLSSFKFVQWAPKDASFLRQRAFWPFKVVQGHPRSTILVTIESAHATSY